MPSSIPESATAEAAAVQADLSPLREHWYFFRQNRGAVLGLVLLCIFIFSAILAPELARMSPAEVNPESLRLPPFWKEGANPDHWLGTDDVGRDLAARLIYGSRVSLGIGFFVVILATIVGTLLGLCAGYAGGWLDRMIMRSIDILMSLPSMLLAIVVVTILGPGLANAIIAVSIVSVPGFVRLVRASVLTEKSKQYVAASRSFGASHSRQIFSNILPNCLAPLIVRATLCFSDGILDVAALGFLGLGAQPPTAEWGTMLADARPYIESAPWMVTLPGLCILVVVLGFNLLGDGLRDAFDPRLKR